MSIMLTYEKALLTPKAHPAASMTKGIAARNTNIRLRNRPPLGLLSARRLRGVQLAPTPRLRVTACAMCSPRARP
jgi:hypothetical protein